MIEQSDTSSLHLRLLGSFTTLTCALAIAWALVNVSAGTSMGFGGRTGPRSLVFILVAISLPVAASFYFKPLATRALRRGDDLAAVSLAMAPWIVFGSIYLLLLAGL